MQDRRWSAASDVDKRQALNNEARRHPRLHARYKNRTANPLPTAECLKDSGDRFLPLWHETSSPSVRSGEKVLIVAHGNSLRALVKYLDKITDEKIVGLNIPTGVPLVYELDHDLTPIKHYYLGDLEAIAKKTAAVAAQGTKKKSD